MFGTRSRMATINETCRPQLLNIEGKPGNVILSLTVIVCGSNSEDKKHFNHYPAAANPGFFFHCHWISNGSIFVEFLSE